jgi:hypothetical protein
MVIQKVFYVATTLTMKMNSNYKIICDNIVNNENIKLLKWT